MLPVLPLYELVHLSASRVRVQTGFLFLIRQITPPTKNGHCGDRVSFLSMLPVLHTSWGAFRKPSFSHSASHHTVLLNLEKLICDFVWDIQLVMRLGGASESERAAVASFAIACTVIAPRLRFTMNPRRSLLRSKERWGRVGRKSTPPAVA